MKVHQLLENSTPYGYSTHRSTEDEHDICDNILGYLTRAHRTLTRSDMYEPDQKQVLDMIYNSWRTDLMHGDLEAWHKSYEYYGAKHTDAFDELVGTMYEEAGLGMHGTYEQFADKVGMK
jgi:hypothetical protein